MSLLSSNRSFGWMNQKESKGFNQNHIFEWFLSAHCTHSCLWFRNQKESDFWVSSFHSTENSLFISDYTFLILQHREDNQPHQSSNLLFSVSHYHYPSGSIHILDCMSRNCSRRSVYILLLKATQFFQFFLIIFHFVTIMRQVLSLAKKHKRGSYINYILFGFLPQSSQVESGPRSSISKPPCSKSMSFSGQEYESPRAISVAKTSMIFMLG